MSCPRKETSFKSEMEMLAMCNRNLSEKGNDGHVRRERLRYATKPLSYSWTPFTYGQESEAINTTRGRLKYLIDLILNRKAFVYPCSFV